MSLRAAVVVASNRAAARVYADETGPLIADWLRAQGFDCDDPAVVPDGDPVREAISAAVDAGARIVLTTGGTGLTPTDRTPEATAPPVSRRACPPPCCRAASPASSATAWWSTSPALAVA